MALYHITYVFDESSIIISLSYLSDCLHWCSMFQQQFHHLYSVLLTGNMKRCETVLLMWTQTCYAWLRQNPQKPPFGWMDPWHSVIKLCDLVHFICFKPQIKLFLRLRFIFKLSSECLRITMATCTTVYCGVHCCTLWSVLLHLLTEEN